MHSRRLACLIAALALALGLVARDSRANNWPPAKGANMQDPNNWPNDPDYTGLWQYYSWLPKQNADAEGPMLGADTTLGASGMSVDIAWTYTIGGPNVVIAVIDNGIEWDDTQVVNKAWLNTGELAKHKPQNADGSACGGTGALAGFDCNGDGIFNVQDYLMDPRIAPTVSDMTDICHPGEDPTQKGAVRQMGDVNHNCIIDAGDLIELFSDGVDDDANGYTDDISGWDFLKNDNDPYDDVRYEHGTGEANWSVSEGNDGQGSIGSCPNCPFFMLRVEEGFIADAADVAKAMVYATDNGAKVIQAAMGSIDMPTFTQAAEDYAYSHGVVVVASMADEDSRHHNFPATANHVLPVHAITGDGDTGLTNGTVTTSSTSFLNFVVCTNYGGQNMLSVSGHSCSSEATGRGAGLAALLVSEGLNQKLGLTPEEVMQLLKSTADVVNVPESRSTDADVASKFVESLPYFSQRFGYGRPNAAKAMAQIDAGMIPPEVDLTSPAWFDVFYADRLASPVPIVGRVAAKRAQSYDYRVEWAAGVEPDDTAFQPIVDWVRNVPASTVTGGAPAMPLGMLAPGQIDTTHTPDPDSKMHENDRTITLRVKAVAHYANGDVPGEARRSIAIVNQGNGLDPDLVQGFPIQVGASMDSSSPKLADIDGDGIRDIVVAASDGSVHVFSLRSGVPAEVAGFPVHTNPMDGLNPNVNDPSVPSYLGAPAYSNGSAGGGIDPASARETLVSSVAVGDLDGDMKNEIVFSSWMGTVYVVDSTGKPVAGWPKRLPLVPSCPLDPAKPQPPVCMDPNHQWARGAGAAPVLMDMDNDGKPEIIQAAFDGNIYIWHGDGTPLPGWPVLVHGMRANNYDRILSTPALGDMNGDGIPDLASGSNETVGAGDGAGMLFLIDGRGMNTPGGNPYFANWPVVLTSLDLLPLVGEGISGSPAMADFVGSGHPQALFQGNGAPPYLLPADPGPQSGYDDPPNRLPDFPGDAGTCMTSADCTSPTQPTCLAGQCVQVGWDPTSIFGDGSQANRPDTMFPLFSSPAIGDLDQDGVPDPIMSGGSLSLASIVASASASTKPFQFLLSGWSGATGHMFYGMPVPIEDYTFLVNETVADITGDGYPEVMVGTGGYFVHAADACGCEAPNWPKFTDGWITATAAVGDLDGDHTLEVVIGTREGNLFAWHTKGTDTGTIDWESFHHDNANTGNYGTKLDQGVLKGASAPIDCTKDCANAATTTPTQSKAGGCGCRTISADEERNGGAALAITGALVVLVVRRRRR
jgi:hypothetical protein